MSSTISSTSNQASLASALLALSNQTQSNPAAGNGTDSTAGLDLDSLQLSGSSLSSLETSAQEIAAQNQNSVISTSEEALATNLAAIAAMFSNPTSSQSSQGAQDPSQVLSLTQ